MKEQHVIEGAAQCRGRLEGAALRYLGINLGITLVEGDSEVVATGQGDQILQLRQAGNRPLRIGRRAVIAKRGTRQDVGR